MCDFPSPHEDVSWIREEFWQEDKVQGLISGQMWWLKAFLQQAGAVERRVGRATHTQPGVPV